MADADPPTPTDRKLWLGRHGETEWSLSGQHTGRTDIPLTDNGRKAAKALAPILDSIDFSLVLSSPLSRARDTAALAGFDGPEIDDDLLEWDYGDYEGATTREVRETVPGWSIWSHGAEGGETSEDVATRVDRVISRVRLTDGPCIVFGHVHALRVLTARWLGLDARDGRLFALAAGAISVVGYEHEWPTIRLWNYTE